MLLVPLLHTQGPKISLRGVLADYGLAISDLSTDPPRAWPYSLWIGHSGAFLEANLYNPPRDYWKIGSTKGSKDWSMGLPLHGPCCGMGPNSADSYCVIMPWPPAKPVGGQWHYPCPHWHASPMLCFFPGAPILLKDHDACKVAQVMLAQIVTACKSFKGFLLLVYTNLLLH